MVRGADPIGDSPEEFGAAIHREWNGWAEFV